MSASAAEHDAPAGGRRVVTQVESLSSLVGAHPDALRKIFGAARATDPAELGQEPRGRLLAIAPATSFVLALRPFLRGISEHGLLPWRGKTFDHGGNSGQNVVLGKKVVRFHAEVGPSHLDGRPALALTYDLPAYANPWPLRAVRDELRTVAPGIAIGPAIFMEGSPTTLLWFGLEAR
jgi:hypothetical protein